MTTNQLIAMLFPIGTAAGVGLTARAVIWWIDRRYAAEMAKQSELSKGTNDLIEMLDQAAGLIQKAKCQLQRGTS